MKKIIIVGSGISGASLANELANKGWGVSVYEKNNFVGGNCYDFKDRNDVLVHKYGPHIFHTSYEDVYAFVSKFTTLNNYQHKVLVNVDNKVFPLPINFKSIEVIMGNKANDVINLLKKSFPNKKTITLFELKQINDSTIKQFVDWISQNVYFNYSSKMWGTKFENINPNTINRVKIILGYEHNYFPEDKYQGLPNEGYTKMVEAMLNHKNIKVFKGVNALEHLQFKESILWDDNVVTSPVVYCGALDELLKYKHGMLPYRSLDIQFENINKDMFQEAAVVNYPADAIMTRIAEYKQMTLQKIETTTISKEYPGAFELNSCRFNQRYYPIINDSNVTTYQKYVQEFKKYNNFYPLGRLAQYKYFDIDDAIKQALDLAKRLGNA